MTISAPPGKSMVNDYKDMALETLDLKTVDPRLNGRSGTPLSQNLQVD